MTAIFSKGRIRLIINVVICCSIFLGVNEGFGQSRHISQNSIYLELLGSGLVYSINYERSINQFLSGRIGFMYDLLHLVIGDDEDEEDRLNMLPLMLNYMPGESKHKFEIGLGMAFVFTRGEFDDVGIFDSDTKLVGAAAIGYRIQPESRGMLFRVSFTPFFGDEGVLPWGGLSFGVVW